MHIIDGEKIATTIKENLKTEIENLKIKPGLAIILANNNPASAIYVKNKEKACEKIGIACNIYSFNEDSKEQDIASLIKDLNANPAIDGIILQSPTFPHLNENYLVSLIAPSKDVDGFSPLNIGYLASNTENFIAATPLGILKLLEYEHITLTGKHIVIIGRSKIVGRPLALALLNRDATVTICHSKTTNLKALTKTADILIVAIGKPEFITADYLKKDAVVIDVGINRINNKVIGDIDFASCSKVASAITPVPKGVGPMTIAMLLSNCVKSAKRRNNNG